MQPGQQKITQFDEVTSTQSGDVIPIVRGGQNKKITVENFTGVLPEGWLTPAEAWTFSSYGSCVGVITIPEGNINRYPAGTRVWFKQGTPTASNKYGIVVSSTTTSLTLVMIHGDLQNLAIQQPAISQESAPRTAENIDFRPARGIIAAVPMTTTTTTQAQSGNAAFNPIPSITASLRQGRRYKIRTIISRAVQQPAGMIQLGITTDGSISPVGTGADRLGFSQRTFQGTTSYGEDGIEAEGLFDAMTTGDKTFYNRVTLATISSGTVTWYNGCRTYVEEVGLVL